MFLDAGQVAADRRDFDPANSNVWGVARFHGPHFTALRLEVARGGRAPHHLRRIGAILMMTRRTARARPDRRVLADARRAVAPLLSRRSDLARANDAGRQERRPLRARPGVPDAREPVLAAGRRRASASARKNINTVDEVPDGPYFVNRAGRMPLTPALVARAANTSDGPAPGKWTVVSAKSDGVTPGFTIRDTAGSDVVHQVRSARLARHGDRQRDRRRQVVLGRRLPHRRVPHRAAAAGEPRDRQGHADHAARRNAARPMHQGDIAGCCRARIATPTARIA